MSLAQRLHGRIQRGGQRVWTCVGNTELNTKAAMPNVVFSDLVA